MKQNITALISGVLFGIGLAVAGMTQPQKVISFLDIAGDWDPTLMFVMIGAIGVHLFAYLAVKKRNTPLFADAFQVPTNQTIDKKLLIGSALFGIGWGIGGYCPGPAITSIVSLQLEVMLFVGAMVGGMILHYGLSKPKA